MKYEYECIVRWMGKDGGAREMRHQAGSKEAAEQWLSRQLRLQADEIGMHGFITRMP